MNDMRMIQVTASGDNQMVTWVTVLMKVNEGRECVPFLLLTSASSKAPHIHAGHNLSF